MLEDYKNALKSGQRAYRACVARGQSPYLAVLDDILVNVNIVSQEPLGLVEIPAESIVGTKTSGRHTAFAPNFMPQKEADVPQPTQAWCIGGLIDKNELFRTLFGKRIQKQERRYLIHYETAPISAITRVWIAQTDGVIDPFFHYYGNTYIGNKN